MLKKARSGLALPGARWRTVIAALLIATAAQAESPERLDTLRTRIQKLEAELNATRGERDEVRERARDTERRIGILLRDLRRTDGRTRQEAARLAALEKQRTREHGMLGTARRHLETAVRNAWLLSRQDSLKLLLSQDDPARAGRMQTYYRYIVAAQTARIDEIATAVRRLDVLEKEIAGRQQALAVLRNEQLTQKRELESARRERRTTLARLEAHVATRAQEIERLRRDEERLTRLVRGLGEALEREPPAPSGERGTGRWPAPAQGRLTARFGQPKATGELQWRGIFLAAREGTEVRAPTRGRVAYADWLRGFGLLLVLDHGNGLMTLYGHNQSLVKNVGDPVEAGETVALSGNTGGPAEPGLYFEVREHGEPRDPLNWCKL